MADFDLDAFLKKRTEANNFNLDEFLSKREKLTMASEDKLSKIQRNALELKEKIAQDSQTWVSRREAGESIFPPWFINGRIFESLASDETLNQAAKFVEGTGQVAQGIAGTPFALSYLRNSNKLPDDIFPAYARELEGTATPEDVSRLDAPVSTLWDPTSHEARLARGRILPDENGNRVEETARTILQKLEANRKRVAPIREALDMSSVALDANQQETELVWREGYQEHWPQTEEAWNKIVSGDPRAIKDLALGVNGLRATIIEGIQANPAGAMDYVMQNVPRALMALTGTGGMAASAGTYAADLIGQGIDAYRENHNGALPNNERLAEITMDASKAFLAEFVGDKLMYHGTGAFKKATDAVLKEGTKEATEAGFKASIRKALGTVGKATLGHTPGRIAARATEGAVGEFGTEYYQEGLEGRITENPVSLEDRFVAGAAGAVVGGAMGGGAGTVQNLTGSDPHQIKKQEERKTKKTEQVNAIRSGNVDALLDEKNKNFNPAAAIDALRGHTNLTTDESQKEQNSVKAHQIVNDLEAKRDSLEEELSMATPKAAQAELDRINAELESTDPADIEAIEKLTLTKEVYEDALKDLAKEPTSRSTLKRMEREFEQANRELDKARTALQRFNESEAVRQGIPEAIETMSNKDATEEEVTQAFNKVITLSQRAPDHLQVENALQLADDMENKLTEPQRVQLREFAQQRIDENALKDMGEVFRNIVEGTPKNHPGTQYMGINQYRSRLAEALLANDKRKADSLLSKLFRFAKDHQAKSDAVNAAGKWGAILKHKDGKWEGVPVTTRRYEKGDIPSGSGNVLNSDALMENIHLGAQVVNGAAHEMAASYERVFGVKPKGIENVQNVPLTQTAQSTQQNNQSGSVQTQTQTRTSSVDGVGDTSSGQTRVQDSGTKTRRGVESVKETQEEEFTIDPSGQTVPVEPRQDKPATKPQEAAQEVVVEPEVQPTQETVEAQERAVNKPVESTTDETPETTPVVEEVESVDNQEENTKETESVTEETVEEETEEIEVDPNLPGKLGLFSTATGLLNVALVKAWKEVNLVAEHFYQQGKSARYKAGLPLTMVKDFLSQWRKDPALAKRFIDLDEDLDFTDEEKSALSNFRDFLRTWVHGDPKAQNKLNRTPAFLKNLRLYDEDPTFEYRDMMQSLMELDEDGNLILEENIMTAMAYAAYDWILSESHSPVYKTPGQVRAMLGLEENGHIDQEMYDSLRGASAQQHTAVAMMGEVAVSALGLRLKSHGSPDMDARLKAALGWHIMSELETRGILKRFWLPTNAIATATDSPELNEKGETFFVEFVREPDSKNPKLLELTQLAQGIRDANKGSNDVLHKLMKPNKAPMFAGTKPVPFLQKYAAKTLQEIPKKLRKAVRKVMSTPHFAVPEINRYIKYMGREAILASIGWVDPEGGNIHARNRKAVDARNRDLESQFDLAQEMLDFNGEGAKFFVEQEVARNFRTQFLNRSLNMQASKLHRFWFQKPSWTTTIKLSDTEMINKFKIAIAATAGLVKTDQKLNKDTLAHFDTLVEQKEGFRELVEAIKNSVLDFEQSNLDDITPYDSGLAAKFAKYSVENEGLQSIQAIIAYAAYEQAVAKAKPDGTFTFTLAVGVDGKTSGPMLTHLALGAGASLDSFISLMNRGGFYTQKEGQATHYSEYYNQPGARDLYQDLMSRIMNIMLSRVVDRETLQGYRQNKEWKTFWSSLTHEEFAAIETITKVLVNPETLEITSAGRNMTKTPVTATGFGAAIASAIRGMTKDFIDGIYTGVEDTHSGKRTDKLPEEIYRAVNVLLERYNSMQKKENKVPLLKRVGPDKLLEVTMNAAQEAAIAEVFTNSIGTAASEAMRAYFAPLMVRRQALNQTFQGAFFLYEAVLEEARVKKIKSLMDAELLPYRIDKKGNKVPLRDLNQEEMQEVRDSLGDMLPMVHTVMSLEEGNIKAGLFMGKSEMQPTRTEPYVNAISVQRTTNNRGVGNVGRVRSVIRMESDPGVAGTAWSIHSDESAIMHNVIADMDEVHNDHDEGLQGMAQTEEMAQALNNSTIQRMIDYSPAREAWNTLQRQTKEMVAQLKEGTLSPLTIARWANSMADTHNKYASKKDQITPYEALERVFLESERNAFNADFMRLDFLSKLNTVDQYTWEGATGQLTEAQREQVEIALHALPQEMSEEMKAVMKYLLDTLPKGETDLQWNPDARFDRKRSAQQPETSPRINSMGEVQAPGFIATEVIERLKDQVPELIEALDKGQDLIKTINDMDDVRRAMVLNLMAAEGAKIPHGVITPFGVIGKPVATGNKALIRFFEQNPDTTVGKLVQFIRANLSKEDQANQRLMGMLAKLVDPNQKVVYVTGLSVPGEVAVPNGNSHGWYAPSNNGQDTFYALSPDFVHSNLQMETMIHELVHGALYRSIEEMQKLERAKKGIPTEKKAAYEAYKELKSLLSQAQEKVKETKKENTFGNAVENIQEFVAWGMTNAAFQREILARLKVKSKASENTLLSGLKAFVRALAELLVPASSKTGIARAESGLLSLIANTSALFAYTAENINAQKTQVIPEQNSPLSQAAAINNYTSEELYQALDNGSLNPNFQEHHKELLNTLVQKLFNGEGALKGIFNKTATVHPLSVWLKAIETGQAPFTSQIISSGLNGSTQEDFVTEQLEATFRTALDSKDANTILVYRQLQKLFKEARDRLTPQDFEDASTSPQKAQEQYDFIFSIQPTKGDRSQHLARFAALGLGNQKVNSLLTFDTNSDRRTWKDGKDVSEKLQFLFEQILEFFNNKIAKTFTGQRADSKLVSLMDRVVDIEAKYRRVEARKQLSVNPIDFAEDKAKAVGKAAADSVVKVLNADFFTQNRFGVIQGAAALGRVSAGNRADAFFEGIKQVRARMINDRYGVVMGTLNNIVGSPAWLMGLLREAKNNERLRKMFMTNKAKEVLKGFKDGGAYLDEAMKKGLSYGILRTGAHNLLGFYDMNQLERIFSNQGAARDNAITRFENDLAQFGNVQHFFIKQAKGLGFQITNHNVLEGGLLLNAHNIARQYGVAKPVELTEAQVTAAEPIIKALITLYGIRYMESKAREQALKVIKEENRRDGGENGVEFLMKVHKLLEKESLERNFDNNLTQMQHGYVPDIYNPHVSMQVALESERENLELEGWTYEGRVARDPHNPNADIKALYSQNGVGMAPRLTTAFSYTDVASSGTTLHNGFVNTQYAAGRKNASNQAQMDANHQMALQAMYRPDPNWDPSQVEETYMVPVLNDKGQVKNWRYMMQEKTKDSVLRRNNDFEHLIGALAGSIFDKESTPVQNKKVAEALKEFYQDQSEENPEGFVYVGAKSTDTELAGFWDLLPEQTKKDVYKVWGGHGLWVREDMMDMVFGYRKLSLAEVFQRDPADRNLFENMTISLLESMFESWGMARKGLTPAQAKHYAKRLAVKIGKGERMWQELVQETKDIIVIKTGFVMMDNIRSNVSFLLLKGVPFKDIIHGHLVGFREANRYLNETQRLSELETLLETGHTLGKEREIRQEINELKDSLERNPTRELIEAGLMPTIVDDIAMDEDPYSFKAGLTERIDKATANWNPTIRKIGKEIYMAHDTSSYKFLSRTTRLSDFVARYTLVQHLTSKKNALSKDAAIAEATEAFVNYDVPMHRMVQYMDDMGLMMFTKYYLGIQRVLLKLLKEQPLRVLGTAALSNYMSLGPIVLEGSMIAHAGRNPLHWGAFQYPATLDKLATVNSAMSLLR